MLLEDPAPLALALTPLPAPSSRREQVCQVPPELPQVLLLVPGKVHQVPQQERLHHGESRPKPTSPKGWGCPGGGSEISLGIVSPHATGTRGFVAFSSCLAGKLCPQPHPGGFGKDPVRVEVFSSGSPRCLTRHWMRKRFQGGICTLPWAVDSVQPRFSLLCPVFPPQIAIYGTNFCTSARNAFFLLMRNIIR